MRGLRGKVALVTGGASGIGFAISQRLLSEGVSVAVLALHQDSVDRSIGLLAGDTGTVIGIAADVSDETAMRMAMATVLDSFGRLDIMVNNAATIAVGSLTQSSLDTWDSVMRVNLRGVFIGCREAARQMLAQKSPGRIINGASGAGRRGGALVGAYSASKFGVIGLTQSLAVELAPHGITVNAVCPGHVTSTPMWESIDREMASVTGQELGSARAAADVEAPMGRPGKPEDVAAAVAFLASDEAAYITGESMLIDGGLVRF